MDNYSVSIHFGLQRSASFNLHRRHRWRLRGLVRESWQLNWRGISYILSPKQLSVLVGEHTKKKAVCILDPVGTLVKSKIFNHHPWHAWPLWRLPMPRHPLRPWPAIGVIKPGGGQLVKKNWQWDYNEITVWIINVAGKSDVCPWFSQRTEHFVRAFFHVCWHRRLTLGFRNSM